MIQLERPRGLGMYCRLYRLYMGAFPASERKPVSMILRKAKQGVTDIWCVMKDGCFAGLAITINSPQVILLDYFAIREDQRGSGVGSEALASLLAHYSGKGLFVEIESTLTDAPDKAMRQRRKEFYLRAGLVPMGVEMKLFGVDMELLGKGCKLDFEGYRGFYHDNYSPWAAEHITR